MAKRYAIWNKETDVITPIGEVLSPEQWMNRYPWIRIPGLVPVIAAGTFNGGLIAELSQLKENCLREGAEFEDGLSAEELLAAIEAWEDARNSAHVDTVSDATRTADALEDLVLLQELSMDMGE